MQPLSRVQLSATPWTVAGPRDFPGKNTGVGCHFLLQCMKVKSESEVAQSRPTPSYPMDCSLPGSSVHGILQARVLEGDRAHQICVRLFCFPGGAGGKEPVCQCRRWKRGGFNPWVRMIPWRRTWQPTPVFLPGESHGQRSLVGYSPWGLKELDMTEVT